MNEIRLVKKAKKGNKEALLQLIMNQQDDFYRLAYSYMGNQHDAMDAMETMILQLYEKIHQLNKEDAFYSWSKTILVNSCKSLLKKSQKVVLVEEWSEDIDNNTSNPYEEFEQNLNIQELLQSINEVQAEAIKLKYLHDLDYQSISEITMVSIGTVKSRIFNGLKKLKELHGGVTYE